MTDMQIKKIKSIADNYCCKYFENEPLSSHTTFGIGGKCPIMLEINSTEVLAAVITEASAENIAFYIIGKGSNLLVDDNDIDMLFIHMGKAFSDIELDGEKIKCMAGASLSAVCTLARDNSLAGIEFAYGIPGNIGGAVYMNAGAYGGEMKNVVTSVTAMDYSGKMHVFSAEELDFSYRHSIFSSKKYIITEVELRLEKGDKEQIISQMNDLTAKRHEKQPLEFRSAGSTFKRPVGSYAALLIEQCGLKGYSCGDAQVSQKHSGFVINRGMASFSDVMNVIEHVKEVVFEQTGIELECEPEIIKNTKL